MKNELTLGSLFDGSGGFPLGGLLAGIKPLWASEIEPFAVRVTTKRLSQIKHYGDVSSLNGAELPPVDIITFGSPCQDMSIAGKRGGLDGSRSSLFYEAVRIIKEMRCATNGRYPRFAVWENVPGAFSSNKGEDFRAVLESLCRVKDESVSVPQCEKWTAAGEILADGFSIAWRVLDAQYWGVPQRRKRIYLVTDFDGECAGKVLFESEGLSGYSAESFKAWQRAANAFESGSGMTSAVCLNDQGGQSIEISHDITATLRAETHGHPPCVMESAAGFCTEHSAKARGIGYEDETSPTLRAGTVPATVYENHSQDTRYTELHGIAPTVSSTYGTGGNNQPFVVEDTRCFDVRFTSDGTKNARHNCYETDTSRTIDTGGNFPDSNQGGVAVVYGICSDGSNSMKSSNPHSGIYHAETARTLDGNGGNPSCNQGGMAVVAVQGSMIGRADKNGPQGSGVNEDVSFTLNATDRHAVAFSQDSYTKYSENDKCGALRACGGMYGGGSETLVYSTSKNSYHTEAEENLANTLVASDYKDPPTVNSPEYIVRRLTPTECARLQGFPDWWCSNLGTDNPTEEELRFWKDVFETHRKIVGGAVKPKSEKQILTWLKNPHSDSAEYKLWGNGVALPCVYFVLSGIAWVSSCSN
ncbi:MAG: DNA (cytosine-5-)-methyltransferase [Ruminiclostridium sp.]|nr:DNA (cytosine-5-)-methyltransferase [Ruminiclostridium sp.]